MDNKEHLNLRLFALGTFIVAVMLLFFSVLYDTQVTNYEKYLAQSIRSITRQERVEASRGIITDRSGRPMVSNRSTYSLTFDASLLDDEEDENEAILRLVQLCRKHGVVWEDNLPITTHAPFSYTVDSLSSLQKNRFLKYVKSLKEARTILGTYLLENPKILTSPEAQDLYGQALLSPAEKGDALVDLLTADTFSTKLLNDAGLTPDLFLKQMSGEMELNAGLSLLESRLILGVQYELSLRKLDNYDAYVLADDISTEFISLLADGNFSGAKITSSSVREYETPYAAHILGTVGRLEAEDWAELKDKGYSMDDWIGREGVEQAFEGYLKGTDGRRIVSSNSEGKVMDEYYSEEPQPGSTVELTIDLKLQAAVEEALAATVEAMNAADGLTTRGASAVVEKVGTGELLALASYPTYDLSSYRKEYTVLSQDESRPLFNRATQGAYPPGSTLKPLTAVAALESEVTTLKERVWDSGRWVYPNDPTGSGAYCWNRYGHGPVDITQAITVSCNYFFAEMGYRMGMDTFNEYLTSFGLGVSSGIEIGDRTGLLPSNKAGENQTPWAAFGQANQLYTPIQLANYVATLVSGGKRCEAHLLKAVKSYDNSEVLALGNTEAVETVEIRDTTLQAVKKGMLDLTTRGSLTPYFKNCVVPAGAKTGTAQLGENITNNGVFVCFAPYDDPEIAVSIVIEQGGSGAALASTAVEILNSYFSAGNDGGAVTGENQLLP